MYVCGVWPVCVYDEIRCPVGPVGSVGPVGPSRLGALGLLDLINSNPLNSNPGVDINAGARWDRRAFNIEPGDALLFFDHPNSFKGLDLPPDYVISLRPLKLP